MKKKIAAVMVLIAVAALMITGTLAFFTAEETGTNVITMGNLDLTLVEVNEENEEFDFIQEYGVMPGDSVDKKIRIKNTGSGDAYVRVKIDKTIELAQGITGEVNPELVTCNILSDNWEKHTDGYYYYKGTLKSGTENNAVLLYDKVDFNGEMGNQYQGSTVKIGLKVQAVQAKNNGTNAMDATGWPTAN